MIKAESWNALIISCAAHEYNCFYRCPKNGRRLIIMLPPYVGEAHHFRNLKFRKKGLSPKYGRKCLMRQVIFHSSKSSHTSVRISDGWYDFSPLVGKIYFVFFLWHLRQVLFHWNINFFRKMEFRKNTGLTCFGIG